jgi:hypothetical protein
MIPENRIPTQPDSKRQAWTSLHRREGLALRVSPTMQPDAGWAQTRDAAAHKAG